MLRRPIMEDRPVTMPGAERRSVDGLRRELTPDASAPNGVAGWDAIAEWTGGIPPDQIEALTAVKRLEAVYSLLHALLGRSVRDFLVRAAALKGIVESERTWLASRDLDHALSWLDDAARDSTLRALRSSGWFTYRPDAGTALTEAGRWAYDVLAFLHKRLAESELLPTVAGIEYALEIGVDPVWHLQSLRGRLTALREEIEAARASHSEVILRRAAAKVEEALQLSAQIRVVLDRIPLDHRAARRVVREIHDLLSRLHGGGAELHAAITEVGRQYLELTAGLTVEQIVRSLMSMTREQLAAVGREALLPAFRPPPLLTPEVVAAAAELQVLRERVAPEPVVFTEPPDAPTGTDAALVPPEIRQLLQDLAQVAAERVPTLLRDLVPREDTATSFLRVSLLPLVGDRRAGEGIAGQLGGLPLAVTPEGDGTPEPIDSAALAELTPGTIAYDAGRIPDG
jgi:hypothetical protein